MFKCFMYSAAVAVAVFSASNAMACGTLLLAIPGAGGKYGDLSCSPEGIVVVNPDDKSNLLGYEVNAIKFKDQTAADGAHATLLKNLGRRQIAQFETDAGEMIRWGCKKGPNGYVFNPNPSNNLPQLLWRKVSGSSTELGWDEIDVCLDRTTANYDPNNFDTTREIVYYLRRDLNTPTRNFIADVDNNLSNGINGTWIAGPSDYEKPKRVKIYFPRDDKNADNKFQLSYEVSKDAAKLKNGTPFVNLVWEPIQLAGGGYIVKNNPDANNYSGNQFKIHIDYRYDSINPVSVANKALIRQAANEWEAVLRRNSKTFTGWINGRIPLALTSSFGAVPLSGGGTAPYYSAVTTLTIDEYVDGMTIYAEECGIKAGTPNPQPLPTGATDVLAAARAISPSSHALIPHVPAIGSKLLTQAALCLHSPQFDAPGITTQNKLGVIKHEIGHALGSVSMNAYEGVLYQGNPNAITNVEVNAGGRFFKGANVLAIPSSPIKLDATSNHYDQGISNTIMTPKTTPYGLSNPTISDLDKRTVADSGYCVVGVNDNPCN